MANRKSTLRERPSIFQKTDKVVPETTEQETTTAQQDLSVTQPEQTSGEPEHTSEESAVLERTTLYLHPSQSDKLDELAMRHKKQTGKRINRSDIIRRLIDKYDLDEPL